MVAWEYSQAKVASVRMRQALTASSVAPNSRRAIQKVNATTPTKARALKTNSPS